MHTDLPARKSDMRAMVTEFETKKEAAVQVAADFKAAVLAAESASCMKGQYVRSIWGRYGTPGVDAMTIRDNLNKSAWRAAFKAMHLDKIAPAADRDRFETAMENPPEFNMDNLLATFGHYIQDPRQHILRGLAEAFVDLDPFFKSHSKVKVGVKGLPKRIIMRSVGDYSGSWGFDRLLNVLNAVRVFEGEPHLDSTGLRDLMGWEAMEDLQEWGPGKRWQSGAKVQHEGQAWTTDSTMYPADEFKVRAEGDYNGWRNLVHPMPGIAIRRFQNGNAHVYFDRDRLVAVNRALAEFYGDTLADVHVDPGKPRPSTEVSANLAFYRTPIKVLNEVMRHHGSPQPLEVLEPSCGEGDIIEGLREILPNATITGIEVDARRHAICQAKGIHARRANFLETTPAARFDMVVMNPPFNGTHWRKHLDHARKFVKPADPEQRFGRRGAGCVICILPATAYYDGHLDDLNGQWQDLPVASFAASGTNVPTGFFTLWAK